MLSIKKKKAYLEAEEQAAQAAAPARSVRPARIDIPLDDNAVRTPLESAQEGPLDYGSAPPPATQAPDAPDNGSNAAVIPDDENDADKALLASEAKVTEADAVSIAEAAHPGYAFKVEALDSENGVIFYELNGSGQSGGTIEAEVNAADGTIITGSEGENEG